MAETDKGVKTMNDDVIRAAVRAARATIWATLDRAIEESTGDDGNVDMDGLQGRLSQAVEQARRIQSGAMKWYVYPQKLGPYDEHTATAIAQALEKVTGTYTYVADADGNVPT